MLSFVLQAQGSSARACRPSRGTGSCSTTHNARLSGPQKCSGHTWVTEPKLEKWVADQVHRGAPPAARARCPHPVACPARGSCEREGLTHLEVRNVHLLPDTELLAHEPQFGHTVKDHAVELQSGQVQGEDAPQRGGQAWLWGRAGQGVAA